MTPLFHDDDIQDTHPNPCFEICMYRYRATAHPLILIRFTIYVGRHLFSF